MGKGLTKRRIDWGLVGAVVLLWLVLTPIVLLFTSPHHGFPGRRIVWSMYTNEPVPDWFPIPMFHADPEKRVVVETQSSLVPDEHIILGVTTHAEWTGTGDTLRVSDATGAIVAMRRQDVVVMPLQSEKHNAKSFQFPTLVSESDNRQERFPVDLSGFLHREPAKNDRPAFDVISMHARYPRGVWAKATIFRFDDGSLVPEFATLHLRGVSRAAAIGMAKAAAIGAAIALFWTWALQRASRWMERRNA